MLAHLAVERARTCVRALAFALLALAGLGGCDDDDVNLVVTPIPNRQVLVFKDSTFNFASLNTFTMPDTVVDFVPLGATPVSLPRALDRTALNRVRQNLIARGYIQIADPRTVRPSFVVLVRATAVQSINLWVTYSWFSVWGFFPGWGWFAPGFTPDWGIVYPWSGAVGVTAYDRGTLVVEIIPTASVDPTSQTIRAVWAGIATGLIDGGVSPNAVNAAVDQMFALSPYLVAAPQP